MAAEIGFRNGRIRRAVDRLVCQSGTSRKHTHLNGHDQEALERLALARLVDQHKRVEGIVGGAQARQEVCGVLVVNDVRNVRAKEGNEGEKQVSDRVEKRRGVGAVLRRAAPAP